MYFISTRGRTIWHYHFGIRSHSILHTCCTQSQDRTSVEIIQAFQKVKHIFNWLIFLAQMVVPKIQAYLQLLAELLIFLAQAIVPSINDLASIRQSGRTPQTPLPRSASWDTVNKRVVRILLECNLVLSSFCHRLS